MFLYTHTHKLIMLSGITSTELVNLGQHVWSIIYSGEVSQRGGYITFMVCVTTEVSRARTN